MDVTKLNDEMKKRVAIAYLVDHIDEATDSCKKPLVKIAQYQTSVGKITEALKQTQQAMQQLQGQMNDTLAGVGAMVELLLDEIPADRVDEWCNKYTPPEGAEQMMRAQRQAEDTQLPPAAQPQMDMAGSSARNLPPPVLPR